MTIDPAAAGPSPPDFELLRPLFEYALQEDRADADVTTQALVTGDERMVGRFVAREAGVAAGIALLEPLFRMRDPEARVDCLVRDGERFASEAVLADVSSRVATLLAVERTALDMLQRLSAVATLTAKLAARLTGHDTELADTRKTTPGWRGLEKYAVRCGGGTNHRLDLSDAAMIKDNHLIARIGRRDPSGLRTCVRELAAALAPGAVFYVEVQDRAELEAVCQEAVPAIQLDGFDIDGLRDAVEWVRTQPPPHPLLEATGSIDPDLIEAIAATGVGRISIDAVTTRATAIDMRMFLVP
jgi:nicotinate-nucleotide pyrophosphorylase (carboxylating)